MSGLRRTRSRQRREDKLEIEADEQQIGGEGVQQENRTLRRDRMRGRGRGAEAGAAEEKASLLRENAADEKPIYKSDVLKFVRVYLPNDPKHDYSDIFPKSVEYTTRGNKRVVFVENPKTGQFIPMQLPAEDADAMVENALQGNDVDNVDADEETALLQDVVPETHKELEDMDDPMEHFNHVIKTIALFCQGIFAGLACTSLYAASVAPDTTAFLENYQDLANETRRLMFVLAVVSLFGSLDQLAASGESKKLPRGVGAWDQVSLLLLVVLYSVCFVCTLVMSAADTRIEYRDGHEGNDWATEALEDSEFERVVDTWFALNTVRFVTAILAWIVASLRHLFEMQQSAAQRRETDSARGTIRTLTNTIVELRGNRLDRLHEDRLRHLIHIHKVALDRTQQALAVVQG